MVIVKFKDWLLHETDISSEKEALEYVLKFILSGTNKDRVLSVEAKTFLKKSVKDPSYTLYRGQYLMNDRVDKNLHEKYNELKVNDVFPEELQSTLIKPYSKKESIAKGYAKEGNLILITKTIVPNKNVIADLEQLEKMLKDNSQDILDSSDFKYMKKDKEVLVQEPVSQSIIIMKTGKLK